MGWLLICIFIMLLSCRGVVNSFAFFPDRDYSCPLPVYASELMLETSDGIRLQCILMRHKPQSERIVIYFHGNAGNLYHRISEAERLFSTGCDVFLSGYRGYGRSSGEPDEEGIYEDGMCVLNYVHVAPGYSYKNIFIYGRSLGTTVAVNSAMYFDVAGVVLITPLYNGEELAKKFLPDFSVSVISGSFNSADKIKNLKCPVLFIHGTDDEVIPYSHGLMLYDTFQGNKKMVTITGGRHNDLEFTDQELYWGEVDKFLARVF